MGEGHLQLSKPSKKAPPLRNSGYAPDAMQVFLKVLQVFSVFITAA